MIKLKAKENIYSMIPIKYLNDYDEFDIIFFTANKIYNFKKFSGYNYYNL